jgi:hypothetical protein
MPDLYMASSTKTIRPSRVILVQGSFVRFRGETLHESVERRTYFVWERNVC